MQRKKNLQLTLFFSVVCYYNSFTQIGYQPRGPGVVGKNCAGRKDLPAKPGNAPGGGILTDSVESQDVEDNIRKGLVGCLFGMYGPEKVRKAESNDENPYLGVLIAAAMVRGYQGKDLLCQ